MHKSFLALLYLARVTFLKAIGIFTDQTKKSLLLKNFYTGNKTMSSEDNNMSKQLVETELVQKEFCKYMRHTGTHKVYVYTEIQKQTHCKNLKSLSPIAKRKLLCPKFCLFFWILKMYVDSFRWIWNEISNAPMSQRYGEGCQGRKVFPVSKMENVSLKSPSTLRTSSTSFRWPTAKALSSWKAASKAEQTITSAPPWGRTWASARV